MSLRLWFWFLFNWLRFGFNNFDGRLWDHYRFVQFCANSWGNRFVQSVDLCSVRLVEGLLLLLSDGLIFLDKLLEIDAALHSHSGGLVDLLHLLDIVIGVVNNLHVLADFALDGLDGVTVRISLGSLPARIFAHAHHTLFKQGWLLLLHIQVRFSQTRVPVVLVKLKVWLVLVLHRLINIYFSKLFYFISKCC
jgi:hypothetical protein